MATDVPHLRAILLFGFAAATAGVVGLTWVYPAYRAKVFDVKEAKQRPGASVLGCASFSVVEAGTRV